MFGTMPPRAKRRKGCKKKSDICITVTIFAFKEEKAPGFTKQRFNGVTSAAREHMTMSGDTLGCHKWAGATGI